MDAIERARLFLRAGVSADAISVLTGAGYRVDVETVHPVTRPDSVRIAITPPWWRRLFLGEKRASGKGTQLSLVLGVTLERVRPAA